MHTVSTALRDFMDSEEVQRLARNSVKKQAFVLRLLVADGSGLLGRDPVARLGRTNIDQCLNRARGRGVSEGTLNSYRVDLRRLGRWLVSAGYVKADPAAHLRKVEHVTPPAKRRPISAEQARRLVAAAEAIHPRDGMTALLMLTTGLRDSEIMCLQWADIDLRTSTGSAYRQKRRDYHTLHLPPQLVTALEKWQAYIEERHGPIRGTWYVVPKLAQGRFGGIPTRMSPEWPMLPARRQGSAFRRTKVWLAAVGETDLRGRASHTLRRTAANVLYDQCQDIRTVQLFLGHATTAMTEAYLDIDAAQDRLRSRMRDFEI